MNNSKRSVLALGTMVCFLLKTGVVPGTLIGHWTFENQDLTETSGFRAAGVHDGNWHASDGVTPAQFSTDIPNTPQGSGYSLDLTGGDYAVQVLNSRTGDAGYVDTFDDHLQGGMTLAFWVKGFPGSWGSYISKAAGIPSASYRIVGRGDDKVGFSLFGTADTNEPAGQIAVDGNQWHHIAAVWDPVAETRKLYIDGELDPGVNLTNDAGPFTADAERPVTFGAVANIGTPDGFQDLKFYDVRFYSEALSEEDIGILAIPEPSSIMLLLLGTGLVAWLRRRGR